MFMEQYSIQILDTHQTIFPAVSFKQRTRHQQYKSCSHIISNTPPASHKHNSHSPIPGLVTHIKQHTTRFTQTCLWHTTTVTVVTDGKEVVWCGSNIIPPPLPPNMRVLCMWRMSDSLYCTTIHLCGIFRSQKAPTKAVQLLQRT